MTKAAVLSGLTGATPGPRRAEIREGRLRLDEAQLHQPARRVVGKDQQGALGTALLKPGMLASPDLNELTRTLPTPVWLMGSRLSSSARHPQAVLDHPLAKGLDRDPEVVELEQLLLGERRTEVGESLPDQCRRSLPQGIGEPTIARLASFLRDQSRRSVLAKCTAQSLDLALTQAKQGAGMRCERRRSRTSSRSSSVWLIVMPPVLMP